MATPQFQPGSQARRDFSDFVKGVPGLGAAYSGYTAAKGYDPIAGECEGIGPRILDGLNAAGGLDGRLRLGPDEEPYVYRALRAGEEPEKGLVARAPNAVASPLSHVANLKESPWISTTKDLATATGKYNKGNGVVQIDLRKVTNTVVDLSKGIPGGGRFSNYAKRDAEVLIHGAVPPGAITKLPGY